MGELCYTYIMDNKKKAIVVIVTIFGATNNDRCQFPVVVERKQNKGKLHGWYFSVRVFGKTIIMSKDAIESFMGQSLSTRQLRKIETGWIF